MAASLRCFPSDQHIRSEKSVQGLGAYACGAAQVHRTRPALRWQGPPGGKDQRRHRAVSAARSYSVLGWSDDEGTGTPFNCSQMSGLSQVTAKPHLSIHPSGEPHQHPKPADNAMILIPESGCAVVKSQGHLGNAGLNSVRCSG